MNHRETGGQNGKRHAFRNVFDQRIVIEKRHLRSERGEGNCEDNSGADVNPEQIAGQRMRDILALEDRLGEPVQADAREQEAERCNHRHNAEISRGEQPRQDHGSHNLHSERHTSRKDHHAGAADGSPPQPLGLSNRVENAVGIESFQLFLPNGSIASAWLVDPAASTSSRATKLGRCAAHHACRCATGSDYRPE